jgi:hypothetical protein
LSGGGHRWFKRSTGEKRLVTRDNNNNNNNNKQGPLGRTGYKWEDDGDDDNNNNKLIF